MVDGQANLCILLGRAHAAALEVTGAGVQQEATSQRTFASALVAAAAAADGVAAPRRAAGRATGGSLRRPGPGEVCNELGDAEGYSRELVATSVATLRCNGLDTGLGQSTLEAAITRSSGTHVIILRCNVAQVMCSFAQNGANYVHQHWYICYTCGLVDQHGCCGACVQACHAGHDTVYSSCSNFFCDCGSGSVRWVFSVSGT